MSNIMNFKLLLYFFAAAFFIVIFLPNDVMPAAIVMAEPAEGAIPPSTKQKLDAVRSTLQQSKDVARVRILTLHRAIDTGIDLPLFSDFNVVLGSGESDSLYNPIGAYKRIRGKLQGLSDSEFELLTCGNRFLLTLRAGNRNYAVWSIKGHESYCVVAEAIDRAVTY